MVKASDKRGDREFDSHCPFSTIRQNVDKRRVLTLTFLCLPYA